MKFPVPRIVEFAKNRDFTDVLVFNEDVGNINSALFIHLPDGPTAYFKYVLDASFFLSLVSLVSFFSLYPFYLQILV